MSATMECEIEVQVETIEIEMEVGSSPTYEIAIENETIEMDMAGANSACEVEIQTETIEIEMGAQQGIAGPPGPVGPVAGANFVQPSESTTWTIPHNLGYRPGVAVATTGGAGVLADVFHLSANTLEIRFSQPAEGTARLY